MPDDRPICRNCRYWVRHLWDEGRCSEQTPGREAYRQSGSTCDKFVRRGLRAVQKCHEINDPTFKGLLADALVAAEKMVIWWPFTGDERRHQQVAEGSMTKWQAFLESIPNGWSMVADIGISIQVLDDLHHRLTDRAKKSALDALLPRLNSVSDWLDSRGTRVKDYEFSSMCVEELYRIIGF